MTTWHPIYCKVSRSRGQMSAKQKAMQKNRRAFDIPRRRCRAFSARGRPGEYVQIRRRCAPVSLKTRAVIMRRIRLKLSGVMKRLMMMTVMACLLYSNGRGVRHVGNEWWLCARSTRPQQIITSRQHHPPTGRHGYHRRLTGNEVSSAMRPSVPGSLLLFRLAIHSATTDALTLQLIS